jgi:hypothetical protein
MNDRLKLTALLAVAFIALATLGVIVYNFVANDWRLEGNPLDLSFLFGDDEEEIEQETDARTSVRTMAFGDSIRSVAIESHGLRLLVTAARAPLVQIRLTLNGDASDSTRFVATTAVSAGLLRLVAMPTGAIGNASGIIELELPPGMILGVVSHDGDISVQNTQGRYDLLAEKGSVELTGVQGRLRCVAAEGDVALEGCQLDSAEIRAGGTIAANLCDGAIAADGARVAVTRHFGSLRAHARSAISAALLTTGAPIELICDEGDIRLRVLPGARFAYDVEAPAGAITSNVEFDSLGPANATPHMLRATTNGGGVPAVLRSIRGSIEIMLYRTEETSLTAPHVQVPARLSTMARRALLAMPDRARRSMEGS